MTTNIRVETAENGSDTFKLKEGEYLNYVGYPDETSWRKLFFISDLGKDGTEIILNSQHLDILKLSTKNFNRSKELMIIPVDHQLKINVLPSLRNPIDALKITINNKQEI